MRFVCSGGCLFNLFLVSWGNDPWKELVLFPRFPALGRLSRPPLSPGLRSLFPLLRLKRKEWHNKSFSLIAFYQASQVGSVGKESACNAGDAGDVGSIPALGRSPRGGHGNPLQYSCLENPMDRGAWRAALHEVMTEATEPVACTLLEYSWLTILC